MALRMNISAPICSSDSAKLSKHAASLVDCTRKKFFSWGVRVGCKWRQKWRTFRPPWPTLPGPGRQPLGGSISLKFLLETRLQSESFDTLDDLLGLWSIVKIFEVMISTSKNIWLTRLLINFFILDHNFWTRNARKLIKGSKTRTRA